MAIATDDARFIENEAAAGGALCLISPSKDEKTVVSVAGRFMNATKWIRNAASEDGGGIFSEGSNSLLFNGSFLTDNRATFNGGAIALQQVIHLRHTSRRMQG